jgi:2-polyprenyl-3-methyl-5-hydroxy-6-metoxy-1,4-benzoquinol methylase
MTKCPLCGSESARKFAWHHTTIWRCRADDCRLRFAFPQLAEEELALAYSTHYYRSTTNNDANVYEETPRLLVQQLFSQLERSLGNLRGSRVLDYGCGRGPICRVALEFELIPTGIEPDPLARSAAAEQLRIPVYANIENLCSDVASPQFDVIILWQVIEHLRVPWHDLHALRRLLHPQGKLVIGTMNANCLRASIERSHWTHYRNPTHFYYPDRNSLRRILTSAGFSEVTEWKPQFRYPQHGALRRSLYAINNHFGIADGLYYLCGP